MYDTAFRVLGVLIARAAGQPLETFLRERIFEPLGMKDTGFSVPPASRDRLATAYQSNGKGDIKLYDDAENSQWSSAARLSRRAPAAWSRRSRTTCASGRCCSAKASMGASASCRG